MTSTATTTNRNVALTVSRVFAGLIAATQMAGVTYFVVIAPAEAVWRGPLLDVPVIALLLTGVLLKAAVALWPGLADRRRIRMGLAAVAISVVVTLVKITAYDEPEGATFLAVDGVLLGLLLLARRVAR